MSMSISSTISVLAPLATCLAFAACGPAPAPASNTAPAAPVAPAVQASTKPANGSGLTATPPGREPQVSSCELRGEAFGVISAGGAIIYDGVSYEVARAQGINNQVVYTGPKVRAVFTPRVGEKIQEDADGLPLDLAPSDPTGTLSIEVAGKTVTTPAREHCVIFE